ncbi:MAG: HYR domain-containing protein, partial [Chloroflexi bacterium]|nr:HYR domain-containing protein [Chloroflexota bacterium]
SLPVNLTAYSFDLGGVTVDYSGVSATDALGGPVTPVCAPASGSIFLVGLTTVQCSATDAAGNTTQGSFFVTVISYDVNSVQASITQSASQLILPGQTATVSTAIADQARLQQQTELRDAVINQVLTVAASVNATQLAAQASLITIASTQVQLDQANSTAAAICSSPAVQAGCTQRATVEMSQIATTLQTMLASQTAVKETLEDTHAALQAKVAVLQEQADDLTEELEETQQRISHPRYLEVEAKPARGQESFSVPITLSVGTYSDAPVRPFGALLGKQHFDVQVKAGDEVGDRRIEVEVRVGRDNRPHLTVRVYKEGPDGGWKKLVDNSAPVVSYDPVTGKLTTKFSMAVKELHGTVFVIGDDETAPALNGMPADITIEATGPNGEIATWTAPTAIDDVDGAVPVSCLPASGGIFPLGTTTVTCSAADEVANSAGATFKVTVRDTTPPTLTLPANIASNVAAVSFTATAADLVSGSVPVTCTPASGSAFPQETTTVACSAADARGNTASGSFIVTVTAPP